ncbi:glycosyltransferase family 39 protein [Amycolatopsis sp. ATCC 39116]|nr:glycosyltransferase family 39 protein [Amycolatopsis sp. ATCC 39116]
MTGTAARAAAPAIHPLPQFAAGPVGVVLALQALVLSLLSGRYGFHRDELYFLAAGKRLDWGYVDQPPITPLLARAGTAMFGDSPAGVRALATVAALATVLLVALVARELGGGRSAQTLAAGAAALSSFVLVVGHMLGTATFDLLVWVAIGLLALRLLRTDDGRWWLAIGAVAGVGLANKWLVLLLLSALGLAVLVTGPRHVFRTAWLPAGVLIATALAAPVVWWQATHGWPLLTVAGGISEDDGAENRILFVPLQLVYLSPVLVPVWIAGMVRLWRDPRLRWARALVVAYFVVCVELLVLGGKPYYSIPLLVLLMAAGAEPTVRWLARGRRAARRALAGALVVLGAAMSLVVALPVLPPDGLNPVLAMNKEQGEQVGWPEFTATVAGVWRQLPEPQRATAVILTRNYGQAGAIERYGPDHGLPRPYSGHMSYADWGPPPDSHTGPVVLVGATTMAGVDDCRVAAEHDNGLGLDNDEQGTVVTVCGVLTRPWSELWPQLRHFY